MGSCDKDQIMIYVDVFFLFQSCFWQCIMMEIRGDLCEREKRESPLWHSAPSSFFFSLSSHRVTRQSACVWGSGATMCSFSVECCQSSQRTLHGRGEEGGKRQRPGGKPIHSLLPLSLFLSLPLSQLSFSHQPPPLALSLTHSLRRAHISALHS